MVAAERRAARDARRGETAAAPFTFAELDAALTAIGGFEPRPLIAVGVSGGPDSLALVILADRWARARGGTVWALIVDHGLRPASAAEARTAAGWLAARDIRHEVLPWEGQKPVTRIQEAARAARYRLLAGCCAARGCLHLLLAHHRDDQAETHLIRRRAGSGIDGLAGMAAVRELPQLRLVRPLLNVPKARLVALLDAEGQAYLRDPSNRNPAFERSRLRLEGAALDEAAAAARDAGRVRIARERALAALLARTVALHPAGFAVIEPAAIAGAGELGERALSRVAAVIGAAAYPLRRERVARLYRALAEAPARGHTLGGCRFVPWRGRVLALREAARAAPAVSLAPGAAALWDGRFSARLSRAARGSVVVGALGPAGVRELPRAAAAADKTLPRLVYPSLPAVWDGAGLAAVPHLSWQRETPGCAVELCFRPVVSLMGAGFTVV